MQLLEISNREYGRYAVVALRGELDLAGATGLRDRLQIACDEHQGRLVLDLGELTFIDSTGLSVLVEYHHKTRATGGRLILLAPRPAVVKILRITGLNERLTIRDRLEEVAAETKPPARAEGAEV